MDKLTELSTNIAMLSRKISTLAAETNKNEVAEAQTQLDVIGIAVDRLCTDVTIMAKTLKAMTNPAKWSKRFSMIDNGYIHVYNAGPDIVEANGADIMSAMGQKMYLEESKKRSD